MKNYKIILSYDGTKYSGWQKQGNTDNTIQGKLENILSKMIGQKVEVFGSGRTDAGAHAKYQVANFKVDTNKNEEQILQYLNEYLPNDIAVNSIEKVDNRFHSRLNAKSKTYLYRINVTGIPNVFEKNFVFNTKTNINVEKMREASKSFIGEYDFFPFCSNKKSKKSTIRKIYSIDIIEENKEIKIYIKGDGFLYNMVRIIVGTLFEIGQGKRENNIKEIFENKKRANAGITMPACGLCLIDVQY